MESLANVDVNELSEKELMMVDGGWAGTAWKVATTAYTAYNMGKDAYEATEPIREATSDIEPTPMVGFGGATAEDF
ncbi:MAG: hypothetical protein ACQERJ_02025 [Bacillota bacterium]